MTAAGGVGRSAAVPPTRPIKATVNNTSVRRRAYARPSQITRFRWPVVMSCAFPCTLVRSFLPDMVSVSSQSFPSPFFRVVFVCVLFTWAVNKITPARIFCMNVHHRVSAAMIRIMLAHGLLNNMFCVSCFSSPAPPTSTYRITTWRPRKRRVGRRRCPLHCHRTPR